MDPLVRQQFSVCRRKVFQHNFILPLHHTDGEEMKNTFLLPKATVVKVQIELLFISGTRAQEEQKEPQGEKKNQQNR